MADVLIYTKDYCPYCHKAKALLDQLEQSYTEIDLLEFPEKRDEMIEKADGHTTVPQIFINDEHIGGCDELYDLHAKGGLEEKLKN
tara:strand:+ start:170 stop:427 length:258 start_codon:yes stop_codon:yes gene_type:complete